jgi:ubiquinone/menaquinone biosynthesis C-methylase UbiE
LKEGLIDIKKSVKQFYEERLDSDSNPWTPVCYHPGGIELTEKIAREIGLQHGLEVLDVASGAGSTAFYLATNFSWEVVGVDLSLKMVRYANTWTGMLDLQEVNFIAADSESLPFKNNTFDAAISECSLCLFPDKLKVLTEMRRVIKPGAKIVISDVFLKGTLPNEANSFLLYADCISGAETLENYIDKFRRAGLINVKSEDVSSYITDLIHQFLKDHKRNVKEVLNFDEKDFGVKSCCNISRDVLQNISFHYWLSGKIGYCIISGVKP